MAPLPGVWLMMPEPRQGRRRRAVVADREGHRPGSANAPGCQEVSEGLGSVPEIFLFELDLEALGTDRRENGPLPL